MAHAPDWTTTSNLIGTGHVDRNAFTQANAQRSAGMPKAEIGYHAAARDFPRFERQQVRAMFDEDITRGVKAPHPEMLRRYPNRELPENDTMSVRSGRSAGSGRSGRSAASQGSRRSAAVSAAGRCSIASSGRSRSSSMSGSVAPPPGYMRQPKPERGYGYGTMNSLYGAGGFVASEPVPGREAWMMGRGGGQISSFDSSLVHKGHLVQLLIDK
eukprot:gnl/TRDRNA2_/TRDRNA2_182591_c0_seq1.p1 gnl/TRDRNA2_/TRDRNA2_182591_c0~~gnl/TRDRNA2_/TRDRNA2_182591_c0_seq1.p1  ORF type:complete len:214 (-),score=24.55 gnl/TRDRNA2_/TRDRNA2_182591_c0_seq1:46-687(-)